MRLPPPKWSWSWPPETNLCGRLCSEAVNETTPGQNVHSCDGTTSCECGTGCVSKWSLSCRAQWVCQPHYGTCADCFSGIIMSLLSWGRAAFPSHSRGLCQHHIQHFYIQRPDTEKTSMPSLLYPIPPPPLLWICPETQFLKNAPGINTI